MKITIYTFLVLTFFCSCSEQTKQVDNEIQSIDPVQIESAQVNIDEIKNIDKKVGKVLFKSILDTVKMEPISLDFLINNQWVFKPFDNCDSYLKFQENGKGRSVNCEMEEEYEMTYLIDENKIYISEYDTPHTDNREHKRIKFSEDTYIYNGKSLIMVDSKMYNLIGKEWTPKIEIIISYVRKKN